MGKDLNGRELGQGLSQRKDGRYIARARVNGIDICLYNVSLKELRKEFEIEKVTAARRIYNFDSGKTLSEWFEEWFTDIKGPSLKNDLSRQKYRNRMRNTFMASIGDMRLIDIRQVHVQMATSEMIEERNYSSRTARETVGVLRECFGMAVVNQLIPANPCTSIFVPNEGPMQERRVLSYEEQARFLDAAKDSYYYEAYLFLLQTGVRIGEFSGLQWQDIDFKNKVIHINRSLSTGYIKGRKIEELGAPKTTNSYRIIPFIGDVEKQLISWKKKQDEYKASLGDRWRANPELGDLVFTSTLGSPVTRYVIVHDIKHIIDNINSRENFEAYKAGREPKLLEHIYPHAFRHTFATRCFDHGMEGIVVQRLMGHANYSTTVSYTHVLDDVMKKELEKTTDFLKLDNIAQ